MSRPAVSRINLYAYVPKITVYDLSVFFFVLTAFRLRAFSDTPNVVGE